MDDLAYVGEYKITIKYYVFNYETNEKKYTDYNDIFTFELTIKDPCLEATITAPAAITPSTFGGGLGLT